MCLELSGLKMMTGFAVLFQVLGYTHRGNSQAKSPFLVAPTCDGLQPSSIPWLPRVTAGGAPSSVLVITVVVMPGAPSSVLATSGDARSL